MLSNIKPFEIYKNIFFVGSSKVSVHVLKTEKGLVMIDTGYDNMYDQIIESMKLVGLDPKDLCAILHSHGHIDHFGCTTRFKELSGATTYISAPDNDIINGKKPLSGADILGIPPLPFFECDLLINDGDEFDFGDIKIRSILTPGHTEGVMSFFITLPDNKIAAMHGGVGINTINKEYLTKNGLPLSLIDTFLNDIERLKTMKVDLVLGNHPEQNDTLKKLEAVEKGESILNENEWKEFLNKRKELVLNLLKEDV